MIPRLYIVIPCYNEGDNTRIISKQGIQKIDQLAREGRISADSRILFVDDGSTDNTKKEIEELVRTSDLIEGLYLDKNYGHQLALYKGLIEAKKYCDIAITIDADGQQDIDAIDRMLDEYEKGNEIVCGVRKDRHTDSFFRKASANLYYGFLKHLDESIIPNHADYRLVTKNAIELLEAQEKDRVFLRGDFLKLPLNISTVEYECKERMAGKSKYTLDKQLSLAADGIRNSSERKNSSKRALFGKLLLAFVIPAAILMGIFIFFRVYPFGSHTIIKSDLYGQYLPIMIKLKNAISNGEGIFYSFNGGLGTNFYALNTYQNASPITWLFLLLFDLDHMELATTLIIVFKIGLIGSCMYYYIYHIFVLNDKNNFDALQKNLIALAFSTLYALSGYVIAYYFNVMWLDNVALLPLVILGLRRVIDNQGRKLYTISLALMLFTQYYLALIMCIFVFLYFFVYCFAERKEKILSAFCRVGILTVFSFMMAMVVLLPTFIALLRTQNISALGNGISDFLYYPAAQHLRQLLPNSSVTMVIGPANLYSGLVSLILFFMFLFDKKTDLRKRIIKCSFVFFIFISTNVIVLDSFWHLMHIPNNIPARYSFVFTFMLIEIALETILNLEEIDKGKKGLAFLSVLIIYGIVLITIQEWTFDNFYMSLIGAIFILMYFIVLYYMPKNGRLLYLALIIFVEIALAGSGGFSQIVVSESEGEKVFDPKEEIAELIANAQVDDPYARMEILDSEMSNAPFVYDYYGLSIFASSVPADTYAVLDKMYVYNRGRINTFNFVELTIVPDALFNISHYISQGERPRHPWLTLATKNADYCLYENPYATSIGYMVDERISGIDLNQSEQDILNQFIEIHTGEKDIVGFEGVDLERWDEAYRKIFDELFVVEDLKGNHLSGSIDVKEVGLFMTSIPYDKGWSVKVDGEPVTDTNRFKYFISFPLNTGEHYIEMKYTPPGFVAGVIISLIGLMLYVLYEKGAKIG